MTGTLYFLMKIPMGGFGDSWTDICKSRSAGDSLMSSATSSVLVGNQHTRCIIIGIRMWVKIRIDAPHGTTIPQKMAYSSRPFRWWVNSSNLNRWWIWIQRKLRQCTDWSITWWQNWIWMNPLRISSVHTKRRMSLWIQTKSISQRKYVWIMAAVYDFLAYIGYMCNNLEDD